MAEHWEVDVDAAMGTRRERRRFAGVIAVATLIAAGCVGLGVTASAPGLRSTPLATASTAAAASPSGPANSLADIQPAPSGTWKHIQWTALAVTDVPGAPSSPSDTLAGPTFQVFGWSKGYVGFTTIQGQPTDAQQSAGVYVPPAVVASYSSDGVHWHVGQKLDLVAAGSTMLMNFRAVIEGPEGLLAVGWAGACGDEFIDSLWTSTDGIAWKTVDAGKVFGPNPPMITHISGGAAGFVAVAYKGAGAWTSQDGRTWKPVALKSTAFKDALIDDGTAIGSSYVLAGITGTRDCAVTVSDGSATPKPVFRTASVWWSADGSAWTRSSLPGAVAKSESQLMWVSHLSNHAVMVVDSTDPKSIAWGSSDGRTWSRVSLPDGIMPQQIVSDGRHDIFASPGTGQDSLTGDIGKLYTIDDNFMCTSITASGDVPDVGPIAYWEYGMVAVGPTGVVVTKADGSQMWIGVPSAG